MLIVFRADASLAIGSGHVMRCLTLASVLRKRGVAARFVCLEADPSNVRCVRPGTGLPPKFYNILLGRRVNQNAKKGTPMDWSLIG